LRYRTTEFRYATPRFRYATVPFRYANPARAAGTAAQVTARRADGHERMLIYLGPMSNAERQRKFREANPGYFRKYHARRKAIRKHAAQRIAAEAAATAAAGAALAPAESIPTPTPPEAAAAFPDLSHPAAAAA
jgi:hypothetical protein